MYRLHLPENVREKKALYILGLILMGEDFLFGETNHSTRPVHGGNNNNDDPTQSVASIVQHLVKRQELESEKNKNKKEKKKMKKREKKNLIRGKKNKKRNREGAEVPIDGIKMKKQKRGKKKG